MSLFRFLFSIISKGFLKLLKVKSNRPFRPRFTCDLQIFFCSSVKLLVSESIIARALNRVLRSCDFYAFLNKKLSKSGFFLRSNVNRNFSEVFQQNKTKTTIILLIANTELGKRL